MIEALLATHQARARGIALGLLGHAQLAEEAAQEALLKAYAARDRYDPARPFLPWFYSILRNTCRDIKARRHAEVGLDTHDPPASPTQAPDAMLHEHRQARALREAMASLSPEHREILELRHFQDLSYGELAELLALPEGTVMSRLYRARRALAAQLEEP